MSLPVVRIIIKVPRHTQVGPDAWENTSYFKTFDLPCPAELYGHFSGSLPPAVVGAEIRDSGEEP